MDASMTEKMNILDSIKKNLQENIRRKAESQEEDHRIKSQPNELGGDGQSTTKFSDRRKQFNKLVISNDVLEDLIPNKNQSRSSIPTITEMPLHLETPTPLKNFVVKQDDDDDLLLDQPLPDQIQFRPLNLPKFKQEVDLTELTIQTSRVEMPRQPLIQERKTSEEKKSPKKSEVRAQQQKRISQQINQQMSSKLQDINQKPNMIVKDPPSNQKRKTNSGVPLLNLSAVEIDKKQSDFKTNACKMKTQNFQKIIQSLQESQKLVSKFYEDYIDSQGAMEINVLMKCVIDKVKTDYQHKH